MNIYINNREVHIVSDSFDVESINRQNTTFRFTVLSDQLKDFRQGDITEIYDDNEELFFYGYVFEVEEYGVMLRNGNVEHDLVCIGPEYLIKKRLVVGGYEDSFAGEIVQDLHEKFFEEEGIEVGTIHIGSQIKQISFDYVTGEDALEELCEITGFTYYIDQYKKLHFIDKETNTAEYDIEWDNIYNNTLRVKKEMGEYRNVQYIKGVEEETNEQVEIKKGNGTERNFTVSLPISKQPKIEVSINGADFVQKTVGIKGIDDDEGFDFLFTRGSEIVTQNQEDEELTEQDEIRITYIGLFTRTVRTEKPDEILRNKNKGIGTGRHENVIEKNLKGIDAGMQHADSLLREYGVEGLVIKFRTDKPFKRWELSETNLPEHNIINQKSLITDVEVFYVEGKFEYNVTSIIGPAKEDWSRFFSKREENKGGEPQNEVSVVTPIFDFEKTWTEEEQPTVFPTKLYPSDSLTPSNNLYPNISEEDVIRYIQVYLDGTAYKRFPVVYKERQEDDNIITIGYVSRSLEGQISGIGWIGGFLATEELETGLLMDYQDFSYDKSTLEILEINKLDIKGWE